MNRLALLPKPARLATVTRLDAAAAAGWDEDTALFCDPLAGTYYADEPRAGCSRCGHSA